MRLESPPSPYMSESLIKAMLDGENPHDTGGLENMRKEDIAPYTHARFTPNFCAPTFEVALQSKGETYGCWSVKNHAVEDKSYPYITLKRTPAKKEGKSVGDKFHISVDKKDVPKAFEVISKVINAEDSPINSWKTTDVTRSDPRNTRLTLGAQFTLYPKPDRTDGTYSPAYMGKIHALVKTIERELQAAGVGQSDHKPASDVSAPQWGYVSYRNEVRSDREGSPQQSASLKEEPFFKLTSST